jgi:hypothetical protein
MQDRLMCRVLTVSLILAGPLASGEAAVAAESKEARVWTDRFDPPPCAWSSRGKNDYFILEPGDQAVFEGHEGAASIHLEITVLNDTRKVAGVETRIVEERETHNGELVEVSRNFFAVCGPTNDVFYFGEDVDIYKSGKVIDHEGSWTAGEAGARAGLFMPSRPLLGARFYQELAPKVAMDRIEILSDSESLKTPAGEFHDCVKTEETTPLEPGVTDYKVYARGVGMIQDGVLLLTKHGVAASKKP